MDGDSHAGCLYLCNYWWPVTAVEERGRGRPREGRVREGRNAEGEGHGRKGSRRGGVREGKATGG